MFNGVEQWEAERMGYFFLARDEVFSAIWGEASVLSCRVRLNMALMEESNDEGLQLLDYRGLPMLSRAFFLSLCHLLYFVFLLLGTAL